MLLALSGCTIAKEFATDPTGKITIDRQEFINTYAVITVLYEGWYQFLDAACTAGEFPERLMPSPDALSRREKLRYERLCQRLPSVHEEVRALDVKIKAKIKIPESEIDWATIEKVLGALIGLVP
jgi:hypothetical protein